jgi:hypothetical protein
VSGRQRALVWLLRIFGGMALFAFGAIFLPVSWMAAIHAWLGMGKYPESTVVDYLARSLSMFYGLIGVLLIVMASDVERFRPIIRYTGWGSVLAGALLLGIGLHAGLPHWWSWHEGPSSALFGLIIIWLLRSVPKH